MKFQDEIKDIRTRALLSAQETLKSLGFVSLSEREWEGPLAVRDLGSIRVSVTLPLEFPDSLPIVRVADVFPFLLPHLEPIENEKRKVCIGTGESLFWDLERPIALVKEILDRARNIIEDGLAKGNHDDFSQEFLAYWTDGVTLASILEVDGTSREVRIHTLPSKISPFPTSLLSENKEKTEAWAKNLGFPVTASWGAFYLSLEKPIAFPLEGEMTVKEVLLLLKDHASPASLKKFRKCIMQLPAVVAVSFPLPNSSSRVLFGFSFPEPSTKKLIGESLAGFRPHRAPLGHQLRVIENQVVTKVKFSRFDVHYLLGRSGGIMDIRDKRILFIGCGSVGSRVAEKLASSGVTRFCLVDPDEYKNENIYRHILPVGFVGMKKAEALVSHLQGRLPSTNFQFYNEGILDVLEKEDDFIDDFDVAIVTTGNESLELRLNQLFYGALPSIFASVEPLGLGGHILQAGVPGQPGCLQCLYREKNGIESNQSFFTAPNQDIRRTHAGCGGSFLPFSSLDADRTALESAQLAVQFLLGEVTQSILLSWYGDPTTLIKEGYLLSSRGSKVSPGTIIREDRHINPKCKICAKC